MRRGRIRDAKRTTNAMIFVGATLLIFRLFEVGQNIVIRPTRIAQLAPEIEVLLLAPQVDQPIDRTGTAKHFAARLENAAVIEFRLRLRLIHPVDALVLEQLSITDGNMNPDIVVLPARFEEQDAVAPGCCRSEE